MSKATVPGLIFLLALTGCDTAPPPVDVEAARESLLQADRTWSQTAKGSARDFAAGFAEDGKVFPAGAPLVSGRANVEQFATDLMALPGFSLSWSATEAHVSSSGDLGYTEGTYELTVNGPDGAPVTDRGKYVTVWEKQADGSWKVVADIFNSDSPPAPPPAAPAS